MTDEAMSPLRRRMIEDMTIRKLAPKTQQGYIRTIKDFAAFLGRSPDTARKSGLRLDVYAAAMLLHDDAVAHRQAKPGAFAAAKAAPEIASVTVSADGVSVDEMVDSVQSDESDNDKVDGNDVIQ